LEEGRGVVSAAVKTKESEREEQEKKLETKEERAKFRGGAARLNYLGQDRPDVQFAAKEVCQGMAVPTVGGIGKVKRAVRYLVGARRLVWDMGVSDDHDRIDVMVDSDWAGAIDRRSTSGGMLVVGGVVVKSWSRTQRVRALSSGEAEFYAGITGCAEGLGLQAVAADLGWEMSVRVWTDSEAGKAMAGRKGLGRTRHIETKYLWIQDIVKEGRVTIRKVWGKENPSDLLTKPLTWKEMADLLARVGGRFIGIDRGEVIGMVGSRRSRRN
jgi:hypothetical protein